MAGVEDRHPPPFSGAEAHVMGWAVAACGGAVAVVARRGSGIRGQRDAHRWEPVSGLTQRRELGKCQLQSAVKQRDGEVSTGRQVSGAARCQRGSRSLGGTLCAFAALARFVHFGSAGALCFRWLAHCAFLQRSHAGSCMRAGGGEGSAAVRSQLHETFVGGFGSVPPRCGSHS